MNGLYEFALETVVMFWFCVVLVFFALGIYLTVKDVIKLTRKIIGKLRKLLEARKKIFSTKDGRGSCSLPSIFL